MPVYSGRYPLLVDYGKGIKLYHKDGREYYDFLAGIGVNALGYGHPVYIKALKEQVEKVIHCSNFYYTEVQAELEKKLAENSSCDKSFLPIVGQKPMKGP